MTVGPRNNKVIVIFPFVGTPAYKAGIHPGDVIIAVDGRSTDNLSTSDVADMLKGPKGTVVKITVSREGYPEALVFTVTRDEIPRHSVDIAFLLKPGIGYIRLSGFNETTDREIADALRQLGASSLDGLILDMRGNPGGLLNEAVAVGDMFLDKNQLIVSHHGRASAETKFVAKKGERGREYPMVVVVDRGTASASEILSGALQDHDRAWILGEQTFGKGLVQAPFPLYGNSALLLTIAKYYTPSGRLIQRDYAHQGFYEYISRNEGHYDPKDMKKTDSGRVVFGGDGITPDEKFETPKLTKLEGQLQFLAANTSAFFFYSPQFFATHPNLHLTKDWKPDNEVVDDFRAFATKQGVQFTAAEFDRDRSWIADRLREELLITAFSKDVSDEIVARNDPEILKAVDSLGASKALLDKARDTVAAKKPVASAEAR